MGTIRKSKHSKTKILKILANADSGRKVADICREGLQSRGYAGPKHTVAASDP